MYKEEKREQTKETVVGKLSVEHKASTCPCIHAASYVSFFNDHPPPSSEQSLKARSDIIREETWRTGTF